jgi:hypothetical protein
MTMRLSAWNESVVCSCSHATGAWKSAQPGGYGRGNCRQFVTSGRMPSRSGMLHTSPGATSR